MWGQHSSDPWEFLYLYFSQNSSTLSWLVCPRLRWEESQERVTNERIAQRSSCDSSSDRNAVASVLRCHECCTHQTGSLKPYNQKSLGTVGDPLKQLAKFVLLYG